MKKKWILSHCDLDGRWRSQAKRKWKLQHINAKGKFILKVKGHKNEQMVKIKAHRRGGVCVLWMILIFNTSTKSWRGYIFTAVCLCVCVCVCMCVCVRLFLWTIFQPYGWTDLDAVFAKRLRTPLVRILLKSVTLGKRSWSHWRNIPFFFIILC